MWTTKKLIFTLKGDNGNCTNYRIAKILNCSETSVAGWENKGTIMNDEYAERVAELLGLNPAEVIADINYERNKDTPSAPHYLTICNLFHRVAASVFVSALVISEVGNLPIL